MTNLLTPDQPDLALHIWPSAPKTRNRPLELQRLPSATSCSLRASANERCYRARGMVATHASARAAAAALALGACSCAAQSVINPGGGYDAPVGGYCRGPCVCIGARAPHRSEPVS